MNQLLAVIIPMYNEEKGAEKCIRSVCQVLKDSKIDTVLYVVNDGSCDNTRSVVQQLLTEPLPLKFVDCKNNQGYGAALLTGARQALANGFEYGLFMDSDLTNDPALIPVFYEKLKEGSWDLIKASRYITGGGMSGVPIKRQIITIVGNKIASLLFGMGIRDCTNGFRAVRLSFLKDVQFHERGFPSIVEELYYLKTKRARVAEIPYTLTKRADGKTNFRYTFKMFFSYFKYAFRAFLAR